MRDDVWIQHEEGDTEYRRFASVWVRVMTVAHEVPSDERERCEPILEQDIERSVV